MDVWPQDPEIVARLALAALFGALLGVEREVRRKSAGLRTHMMVCLGSATFTLIGFDIYDAVAAAGGAASSDPLRILQGIVGGLGFLGAGAILQSGLSVRGLTTAGSLWLTGAIGVAIGGGQYLLAGVATGLGLLTLLVGMLERRVRDDKGAGWSATDEPAREPDDA